MALLINGEKIEESIIQGEMQRASQGQQQLGLSGMSAKEAASKLRQVATDRITEQVLISQQVEAEQPEVTDQEVEDEFNKTAALYGGQSAFLSRNNLTEDDLPKLRERIRHYLQTNKLLEQNSGITEPEEEELKTFFQENKDRYRESEQVRVSHIVKKPSGNNKDEVYNELCDVRRKIVDEGSDFGEMADNHSECTDEPKGDLGYFGHGKMVESFETVVFSMNEGEVSPVFLTEFGYHIAKLTGYKGETSAEFEDVRDQVLKDLREKRQSEARRAYIKSLRENAVIEETDEDDTAENQSSQSGSGSGNKKSKK